MCYVTSLSYQGLCSSLQHICFHLAASVTTGLTYHYPVATYYVTEKMMGTYRLS